MATGKKGLDYFPMSVDFFDDDKMQLIESEFGAKGVVIASKLLCKIYKEGYFYKWGVDECLLFATKAGRDISNSLVSEVVTGLIKRSFFDKGVFDSFGILTSKGIQQRYFEATERRKSVSVFKKYLLINVEKHQNVDIIDDNVDIMSENANIFPQSKVEESKGKKSKVIGASPSPKKFISKNPEKLLMEKITPFVDQYGKQMCREFYDYWTEKSEEGARMRFEMEKVFDVKRRLATWKKNESKFTKGFAPEPAKYVRPVRDINPDVKIDYSKIPIKETPVGGVNSIGEIISGIPKPQQS